MDGADAMIGSSSKRDAHCFDASQPGGLLHRAFSVFLFDASDRLLLQQRAPGKVPVRLLPMMAIHLRLSVLREHTHMF